MKSNDLSALKNNIIANLKESQLKVGYTENAVTLNYTAESLCRLCGTDEKHIDEVLESLGKAFEEAPGEIGCRLFEGRYAVTIPPQIVRYVHESVPADPFLEEFISAVKTPFALKSIDDVLALFGKYSDKVICRRTDHDEFEYAVWFADGKPDSFIYCIDTDFGSVSYHRFTKEDYTAMGFKAG